MIRPFRLYRQETRWWSFADHENLMQALERFRPQSVLEVGPGASTLAFVEFDVPIIDAWEDDPAYMRAHQANLSQYRNVALYAFDVGTVPPVPTDHQYDLAFIDGPRNSGTRRPVIEMARRCADVVLCHDANSLQAVFPDLQFERIGTETGLADIGVLRC